MLGYIFEWLILMLLVALVYKIFGKSFRKRRYIFVYSRLERCEYMR